MNNRTACGLALLLLVQAMSAALYVMPVEHQQEDWQGPVFESGARSNNSTSGCGYDVNYTTMNTYTASSISTSDYVSVLVTTYCDLLNTSMYLTASLTNQNNGSTYSILNASYSGTNASYSGNWAGPASALGVGNYTLTATLQYYDGSTWTTIETDTVNFTISTPAANPCGVDPNSASVYAYSHQSGYQIGSNFTGSISTYCSITNSTMVLDWTIHSVATNSSIDSGSFNWTALYTYDGHNVTSTSLASVGVGNYSFEVTLSWYNNSSMSWEVLDSDSNSFFVHNNTNSGPGSLGCGYDLAYTDLSAYAPSYGNVNQSIDTMMYVLCPIYNSTMLLNYWIYDGNNVTLDSGNYSWTASSNGTTHSWNATSLPSGNYTFHVELYSNGTYVTSDSDSFPVLSNTSGGGGNTGGNNTGGNNTNEYIDIDHSGYAYETSNMLEVWDSGTDVHVEFTSGNLVVGENYQLIWNLSDSTYNVDVYGSGNVYWNASSTTSQENSTISGLADGVYYFHATLVNQGSHIASDTTMIQMGNNTGGNNTGGNNTGGNNSMHNVAHCLQLRNISVDSSYYVSVDLENSCSIDINYPGINASTNTPGVSGLSDTWWYLLWANGTYNSGWQLSFNQSVQNNTLVTLNFSATILNCGPNGYHACPNSMNSSLSHQFTYVTMSGNNTGGNGTGNNTGGNNTGGNNANDCLDNTTSTGYLTELSIWTDKTEYVLGETTYGTFYVNCTVVGENYQLRYWIDAGASYDSGWWNWTATQEVSVMTLNWTLPDAVVGYHLHGELELDGLWLANVISDAFDIVANNNGGNNAGNNTGGNNTGGNNTGNNTGGNNTGGTGNNTGGNNTILDADGDGVLDADDYCPNSTPGASVDSTGCEASVQPVNNPPEVTNVIITPLIATVDDTLTCGYSTTDSDGDAVTTIVTWAVNGSIISAGSDTLSGGFGVGQTVTCSVVANDGAASSSPFISTTIILPSGSDEVVEDAGGLLPSLSMMGTLVAIAFGVGLSRRQDD